MQREEKPWERQPGETSPAWEARKLYIHMGPGRSLDRVVRESHKDRALIGRWSSRWKWVASAAAFDAYRDELAAKAALERHIQEAEAEAAKWARRDREAPEMIYSVFLDTVNDIAEFRKAGKKDAKAKATLVRNLALMAPLQKAARDEVAQRVGAAAQSAEAQQQQSPASMSGRAKAGLKAFNEFKDREEST